MDTFLNGSYDFWKSKTMTFIIPTYEIINCRLKYMNNIREDPQSQGQHNENYYQYPDG